MSAAAVQLQGSPSPGRLQPIDTVRGAVMIIMALDHTREFFHSAALQFNPEDLTHTTAAIFFTRWITHFCAPVFMLTAGLGAFFWGRNKTKAQLSRFLLSRGIWLILLELTVLRLAFNFNFDTSMFILTVLWALGWSMIALAAFVYLPIRVLAVLSIAIIAGHNLLDNVPADRFGSASWLWNILHQPGMFMAGKVVVIPGYPLIPWIAVMAAGYCLGPVFQMEPLRRQRVLIRIGFGLTAAFVLLRALNVYGDPLRWSSQPSFLFTTMSFLRCLKYPPSLLFILMTLGPAIAIMGLIEKVRLSPTNPLVIFGRVPLFYFLGHLFLIHTLAVVMALIRYNGHAGFMFHMPPSVGDAGKAFPANYGYNLPAVYVFWIVVVVAMYPLCRWFAGIKQRRRDWWLSYL